MQSQPTTRPPRGQQLPDQTRRPSGATGKSLPMPPPGVPIRGASDYISQQRTHTPHPAQSQGQQGQPKQYSSIRHHQSNSTTQPHHSHTGNSLPRSRPAGSVSSRPSPTLSSTSAEDRLNRPSQNPGEMFGKADMKMGPPQQTRHVHQSQYSQQGQQPRGMTTGRAPAPTGRHPSANLVWGDDSVTSPREPDLITPKENYVPHMSAMSLRDPIEQQFDDLLDSLQVPASVREKFSVVSTDVKTSILTSSLNSNPTILSALGLPMPSTMQERPKVKKRLSTPLLRKAKSSGSLGSPGSSPQVGKTYSVEGDSFVIVASPLSSPNPNMQQNPFQGPVPQYRQSMDMSAHSRPATTSRHSTGPRPMSMSVFGPSSSSGSIPSYGRSSGKGLGISMPEQPDALIHWLRSHKGTDLHMDVARCKKLRMLLRHESTIWVGAFLEQGGYELILARLTDLLEVEWREEQHDDQMLYELLRCVKALSTSEVGKDALRTCCPKPFKALSGLLFSEKKPGDLPTRQIIIELWLFLFELYPSSTAAAQTPTRPSSVRFDTPPLPFIDIPALVRELVLPEIPDPRDEQHEFITQSHRPRVFRAWVQELSDICRDYFWIMCHASNSLWDVEQVDHNLVERPVAPGGATGGVEFEAMNYATTHFKLLNALCARTAKEDMKKAVILHGELLSSGMDRILVTMRKASTAYYPTLHLELARYVALLRSASPKNKLPHLIDKLIGPPPEAVRLKGPNGVGSAWLPMPVPTVGAGRRGAFDLQG